VPDESQRSVADSVEGTESGDFRLADWGQLVVAALIFGSAFLWIALALRSIAPGTIAFGRALLGAAALALIPSARKAIARIDWRRLLFASLLGVAAPVLLFALGEERIASALAGMLVSAVPIFTAAIAAVATRSWPKRRRLLGLLVGLLGIVLLTAPDLASLSSEAVGVVMVLAAVLCYALATAFYAPLQQTYGATPVTLWLLVVSTVLLLPLGILGIPETSIELVPMVSLVVLGVVGTGLVWAMFVSLIGRVGAVRASIVGYLIPIFALLLGVAVLDERVTAIQVAGVTVALLGGYLISRGTNA